MSHNSILKTLVIVLAIMQITACGSVANFTSKDTFQGIRIGDKAELIRFPITYYTNDETPVVLLTSPLIFTDTELYEGEHTRLIPWLNSRGFTVFLVRPSKGRDLNDLSSALPEALKEVRELSRGRRIVLGGLSLGGQAALEFLLTESAETRFISRVFFLGTGFDYEYPGSFLRRMTDEKWPGSCSSATSLCSLYLQSKEEKGRSLKPGNMQNAKLNFDSQKSVLRRLSL
ncbi:MAG: hypothetical protein KDK38_10770, partial [Leptospiraceae bacterium]|nr:hypothetical protein [Leptospiraceae bacterium]